MLPWVLEAAAPAVLCWKLAVDPKLPSSVLCWIGASEAAAVPVAGDAVALVASVDDDALAPKAGDTCCVLVKAAESAEVVEDGAAEGE